MNRGIIIMSNEKGLISLALIKTTWEENKKDTIDMLIPFILFSISEKQEKDIISIEEVRQRLLDDFSMDIYSNVIESIIKRLTLPDNSSQAYITKKKGVCYRATKPIDTHSFSEKRMHYQNIQSKVIDTFIQFLQSKDIIFEEDVAEKELISYLCKYGHYIINENFTYQANNTIWTKRIGEFVESVYNKQELVFRYLTDIAKGGMLSTVYFNTNYHIKASQRFKDTRIYLDTPLLMHILNYSGESLKRAAQELLELLQKNGATVHAFEHNLHELEDILEAYVKRYRRGTLNTSYNFDYLIEQDVQPEKIETDIPSLTNMLRSKGITIDPTPPYDEHWKSIGNKAFNEYLSQKIHYKKDDRRDNDVESIAAIYRLRKQEKYHKYETCDALFVATNSYLVYYTQKYFKEEEKKYGIPAIVDDTFLTSLLWVKYVHNEDTLPTLKLIVDALAAQEPSQTFWDSFNRKIDELKERGEITEDELIELKYGTFSKKNMYDVTEGDVSKITHDSVALVKKMNFRMEHKEIIKEKETALEEKSKAENEKEAFKQKYEETHQQLIEYKATPHLRKLNKAQRWSNIIGTLLFSVILYLLVSIITNLSGTIVKNKLAIDIGVTGLILVFAKVFEFFLDEYLSQYTYKIKHCLYNKYKEHLYIKIQQNEPDDYPDIIAYLDENQAH